MLAQTKACSIIGLEGCEVDVEVDIAYDVTQAAFSIVGLPEKAIQESRERIRAAIVNTGIEFPDARITVSLAPADIKKTGTYYDLPIAVALLVALGKVRQPQQSDAILLGELALDGAVRATRSILPLVKFARDAGYREVYIPDANREEAMLVPSISVYPVTNLSELLAHMNGEKLIAPLQPRTIAEINQNAVASRSAYDMIDVRGQEAVKQGLLVAAAGGHNVLMSGPPGTGKTLLARTLTTILPPLLESELLEVVSISSIAGMLIKNRLDLSAVNRPFRSPHYSISDIALVGGGNPPRPGEITLSHRGVLFMDEFPEFSRKALESLRQPMEDREVTISRSQASVIFPANFLLLAAMNPCPCGNYQPMSAPPAPNGKKCVCSDAMVARYKQRLSGPLLDRIDIFLDVPRQDYEKLQAPPAGQDSAYYRERVIRARERQYRRFEGTGLLTNNDMGPRQIWEFCQIGDTADVTLRQAVDKHGLSARTIHRTLRLARTIADLEDSADIRAEHIFNALGYRSEIAEEQGTFLP